MLSLLRLSKAPVRGIRVATVTRSAHAAAASTFTNVPAIHNGNNKNKWNISTSQYNSSSFSPSCSWATTKNDFARSQIRNLSISASLPPVDPLHRSNAESLIAQQPPIEVDSDVAVCDGGTCNDIIN